MPYVTESQITAILPRPLLVNALDDDGDGHPDDGLLDAIIAGASQEVDALLAPTYTVPFTTAPAIVSEAALCFTLERIWDRRGIGDEKNPHRGRAAEWRQKLRDIGAGRAPLEANTAPSVNPGIAIVEDARTMGGQFL